jgi:hypothetical protein
LPGGYNPHMAVVGAAYRTPLQRERRLRDWTLEEVVDRIKLAGHELGYGELAIDANTVSRHERGQHLPSPVYRACYLHVYGAQAHDLWPELGGYTEDVERRAALRALAAAIGGIALDGPERLHRAAQGRVRVDAAGITVLRDGVAHARQLDDVFGAGAAIRPALVQRELVTTLIERTNSPTMNRRLAAILAELEQFFGWLNFDAGDYPTARRHLSEGLQAAHEAGDDQLAGYLLAYHSILAKHGGSPYEGLAWADAAVTRAKATASPRTMAWLQIVERPTWHDCHAKPTPHGKPSTKLVRCSRQPSPKTTRRGSITSVHQSLLGKLASTT